MWDVLSAYSQLMSLVWFLMPEFQDFWGLVHQRWVKTVIFAQHAVTAVICFKARRANHSVALQHMWLVSRLLGALNFPFSLPQRSPGSALASQMEKLKAKMVVFPDHRLAKLSSSCPQQSPWHSHICWRCVEGEEQERSQVSLGPGGCEIYNDLGRYPRLTSEEMPARGQGERRRFI